MISNFFTHFFNYKVLEYMVISKGKLYHHKMKLRKLEHDSKTKKFVKYLKKRHPRYIYKDKITDD